MSRVLSVISTETHDLQITKKLSTRYITILRDRDPRFGLAWEQ